MPDQPIPTPPPVEPSPLDAAFAAQNPPSAPPPGEPAAGGAGEEPRPGSEETPPTAETPNEWDFDFAGSTHKINRDQIQDYAIFDAWLESNPDVKELIQGVLRGDVELSPRNTQPSLPPSEGTPPATAAVPGQWQEPTVPEELDLDDPAQRILWERTVAAERQNYEHQQALQRQQEALDYQGRANAQTLINRAKQSFQQQHELSPEDTETIFNVAQQAVNIEGLVQSTVDPWTGAPRVPDALRGLEEAMEMAQWSLPDFREKEMNRRWQQHRADVERQGKINALGGTGGGQPRPPATGPMTREQHRQAMIDEIAAATNQPTGE